MINSFHVSPVHADAPDILDGCDLAIGFLEEDFSFALMLNKTYLSYLEKERPEVGDIIRVIGYPGEKQGRLYEMEGKIQQILRTENNKEILDDNIDTTE